MIDGLALGETTPGPLIMVVAFVAFVNGYVKALFGPTALLLAGATAAALVTWFTFLPSFLFNLAGGPLWHARMDVPDGMSLTDEIKRRKDWLKAMAVATAKIEDRAKERFKREQAAYEAKVSTTYPAVKGRVVEARFRRLRRGNTRNRRLDRN